MWAGLGLGPGRTFSDVLSTSLVGGAEGWSSAPSLPVAQGRLAATAQWLGDTAYVFGGYTVAADGAEVSTPQVYALHEDRWSVATSMPVPVDDAVSGVWRDGVVLVSGWHDRDNVAATQYFVPGEGWRTLPAFPGEPVFGHAGGVVRDTLVTCDGVGVDRSRAQPFFAVAQCHALALGESPPRWRAVEHHGRPARYRVAAGPLERHGWIVFAGGTGRPYNYDGVGYDGIPATAQREAFAYEVSTGAWIELPPLPRGSMDARGLIEVDGALWLVGGMHDGGVVHDEVWMLRELQ
ncbi:MAG: hypothetical protein AAGA54_06330 [Myxococcota bacterium]